MRRESCDAPSSPKPSAAGSERARWEGACGSVGAEVRFPAAERLVNVRRDYLFQASGSKATGQVVASAIAFQELVIAEQSVFGLDYVPPEENIVG